MPMPVQPPNRSLHRGTVFASRRACSCRASGSITGSCSFECRRNASTGVAASGRLAASAASSSTRASHGSCCTCQFCSASVSAACGSCWSSQRETRLLPAEIVAAALAERLEPGGHDPDIARGVGTLQRRVCQCETQEGGIGLRMVGEERYDLAGTMAVEQEIGVGDQQEIVVRRESQRLAIVRLGARPVAQPLEAFRQQALHPCA